MDKPLRVLIVDDSEADALFLQRALRRGGLEAESTRVDTAESMRGAMAGQRWDVAISDCLMPGFSVEGALEIWKKEGDDQPLVVVSGAIGEEEAVALLKAGAQDFVRKDNLARLVPCIERELREAEERRRRRLAEKELRESEQKYRLLFSAESDAIVILDAQTGRVIEVNPAAANLFGYKPEEFTGLDAEAITVKPGMARAYVEEVFQGEICRFPLVQKKKKDGTIFPAEISAGPFAWHDRRMIVLIIRDITEQQRIVRMKDEMLSAVSHEMRTPLTSIIGFIDFMLEFEVDSEQRREFHQIIAGETRRLKELIDDLLSLQVLRAGYDSENFRKMAILPLLHTTADHFAQVSEKHHIDIDSPPDLPPLWGDERILLQALRNLVSNAIKYSPSGGTVTLGAKIKDNFVILSVADEGPGIAPEELAEIFDRFFRIDTNNRQRRGATGLGLPLVKEIAKAHRGRAWVESSLGKGSTFYLSIPLEDAGRDLQS